MQIRTCTKKDIEVISQFAHNQNTYNAQRTSFMYKEYEKVKESFYSTLDNGSIQIGAFHDKKCFGYVQVITNKDYGPGDVIGPFYEYGNERLVKDLLSYVAKYDSEIELLKFNIDENNKLGTHLVEAGAIKKEDNYQLRITKDIFANINLNSEYLITQVHSKQYDKYVIDLYNSEFPDSYMNSDSVIDYNKEQYKLVDLLFDSSCIGFGFYRIKKGYIDFVAVDKKYRGRGYGKYLLSRIIRDQIDDYDLIEIELNVDLSRNEALKLYTNIGFTVNEHFISYHLNKDDIINKEN